MAENRVQIVITTDASGAVTGIRNAEGAIQSLGATSQSTRSSVSDLGGSMVVLAGAVLAIKMSFLDGLRAVDDFRMTTIAVAATLTDTFSGTDEQLRRIYRSNLDYAEQVYQMLAEESAKHFASGKEIVEAWQILTQKGVQITSREDVENLGIIVDRIKLATKGQVASLQIAQELRAALSGQARAGDQLAMILRDKLGAEWEKQLSAAVAEGKALEFLGSQFRGLKAATSDITTTLTAQKTTLSTIVDGILRGGMSRAYRDISGYLSEMNDYLREHRAEIADRIANAWEKVRSKIDGVKSVLQSLESIRKAHPIAAEAGLDVLGLGAISVTGVVVLRMLTSAFSWFARSAIAAVAPIAAFFAGIFTTLSGITLETIAAGGAMTALGAAAGLVASAILGWKLGEAIAQWRLGGKAVIDYCQIATANLEKFFAWVANRFAQLGIIAQKVWIGIQGAFAQAFYGMLASMQNIPVAGQLLGMAGVDFQAKADQARQKTYAAYAALDAESEKHNKAYELESGRLQMIIDLVNVAAEARNKHTGTVKAGTAAFRDSGDTIDRERKRMGDYGEEAARAWDKFMSPHDKVKKQLEEIDKFLVSGAWTRSQWETARETIWDQYEKAIKPKGAGAGPVDLDKIDQDVLKYKERMLKLYSELEDLDSEYRATQLERSGRYYDAEAERLDRQAQKKKEAFAKEVAEAEQAYLEMQQKLQGKRGGTAEAWGQLAQLKAQWDQAKKAADEYGDKVDRNVALTKEMKKAQDDAERTETLARLNLEYGQLTGTMQEQLSLQILLLRAEKDRAEIAKDPEVRAALERNYEAKRRELEIERSGSFLDGFNLAAEKYRNSLPTLAQQGKAAFEMITKGIDSAADALAEFTMTGKMDFASFANSIIRDILRMQYKALLTQMIMGSSGSAGGWGGILGWIMDFFKGGGPTTGAYGVETYAGIGHRGGMAESLPDRRFIASYLFSGAPRLHEGLAPDEFPAILQRGERVLSRKETRDYAAGNQAPPVVINVENKTGTPVTADKTKTVFDGKRYIINVILDDYSRYGDTWKMIRGQRNG